MELQRETECDSNRCAECGPRNFTQIPAILWLAEKAPLVSFPCLVIITECGGFPSWSFSQPPDAKWITTRMSSVELKNADYLLDAMLPNHLAYLLRVVL